MKYYLIMALAVATSVCTTACRDKQVSEPRQQTELVVSQQETLTIPATAAEHRISVKTNVQGWTCLSKKTWLQAKASGGEIILYASANTDAYSRETTVQVIAEDQVRTFKVMQHGIKAVLDLSHQPDMVDQWGAEIVVDINTNVSTWTVESSEDWVVATPRYKDDQILLKVVENETRYDRSATITVKESTSGIKKEFGIVQRGMVYHLLPFTGYESSKEELIEFEVNRKSKLVQTPTEYNPVYKFETISPLFRTIAYTVDIDETIKHSQAFFDPRKMSSDEDKKDFYKYLSGEGFDHEGEDVYYSTKHQTEVEVKSNYVLYTYYPLEKGEIQPIEALPLEDIELNVTTPEQIKKYQSDRGREYVEKHSKEGRRLVFRSWDAGKEELHVYYFGSAGALIEAIHFYENKPKYMYTAENLKTYFTRELRKAIHKAKFSFNYYSEPRDRYSYVSSDRKTEMLVEQVKHPYPEQGQTPPKMVKIKFQVNRNN